MRRRAELGKLAAFRQVRDQIRALVETLPESLEDPSREV